MKKLEKRAIICLLLAAVLLIGLGVYTYRYVHYGHKWATFYGNSHLYHNGVLAIGKIYDRNGVLLAANGKGKDGKVKYNSSETVRRATAHAVGDMNGNVSTSAESVFKDKMVGYNLLTGTYSVSGKGSQVHLSISAKACKVAYEALGSHNGVVGVYNYKTGEILCMVSKPTFDPENPASSVESGTYMNKFLSGRLTPGSTFKLVTSAAAIENLKNLDSFSYYCTGVRNMGGWKIRCDEAHGRVDFESALAKSCNCAFSVLSDELGNKTLAEYTKKAGLETAYNIDGIHNAKGTFDFPSNSFNLAWAGIGQWKDQVNPCSMMVYMGAIARDGVSVVPRVLKPTVATGKKTDRMIQASTAEKLKKMMRNNVEKTYGASNFPGLNICAKTGTAEVNGAKPNAWFDGFLNDDEHPYAFVVCVEDGGFGQTVAAPVANKVLQELVKENS
jgi:peptidoglycan glycosyltransferase